MAVIWQKKVGNQHYEIRTAGQTRRLYTNGVCHSQYHPKKPLTGSIWDLLLLPAFFQQQAVQRVLVLGVGGGAVIRQFNEFFQPQSVIGVELEETHLLLARRFFALNHDNIELIQDDAVNWVENYTDPTFDIVIEDLFTDCKRQPTRAVPATKFWCQSLFKLLNDNGILVMNYAGEDEFRVAAANRSPGIKGCRSRFKLTHPKLDNVVGVYSKQLLESTALHNALRQQPVMQKALNDKYLQYRLRKCRAL